MAKLTFLKANDPSFIVLEIQSFYKENNIEVLLYFLIMKPIVAF